MHVIFNIYRQFSEKQKQQNNIIYLLLTLRHNAERFSKWAFVMGEYQNQTLASLVPTNRRDFATFMALSSSKQGLGGETAENNLKQEMKGQSWTDYCASIKE